MLVNVLSLLKCLVKWRRPSQVHESCLGQQALAWPVDVSTFTSHLCPNSKMWWPHPSPSMAAVLCVCLRVSPVPSDQLGSQVNWHIQEGSRGRKEFFLNLEHFSTRAYASSPYPPELSSLCHLRRLVHELTAKRPCTQKSHHLPWAPRVSLTLTVHFPPPISLGFCRDPPQACPKADTYGDGVSQEHGKDDNDKA